MPLDAEFGCYRGRRYELGERPLNLNPALDLPRFQIQRHRHDPVLPEIEPAQGVDLAVADEVDAHRAGVLADDRGRGGAGGGDAGDVFAVEAEDARGRRGELAFDFDEAGFVSELAAAERNGERRGERRRRSPRAGAAPGVTVPGATVPGTIMPRSDRVREGLGRHSIIRQVHVRALARDAPTRKRAGTVGRTGTPAMARPRRADPAVGRIRAPAATHRPREAGAGAPAPDLRRANRLTSPARAA